MLEVGEGPDSVTKTGVDGGIPAFREAARRTPRRSRHMGTAEWTACPDATA